MGSLVKYGSYDMEAAKAEQEQLQAEGGEFMKLAVGKTIVRVLPPPVGRTSPFVVTYQHYINSPEGNVSFTCPRMMAKKTCPACAHANKLRASGIPADRDLGFQYLPKRRIFMAVIDRKQPEAGAKILPFGKMIHEQLISLRTDEDWGDFCHPEEGYDLAIERVGTGKTDTEYKVLPRKKPTPLSPSQELMNEWLTNIPDLTRFTFTPNTNEILKKLSGAGIDVDDDPEEQPKKKARTVEADLEDEET